MQYTDDEIHAAFLADEAARLALLAENDHLPQRNAFGEAALTDEQADYTVTYDEVDRAIVELAGQRGVTYSQAWDQVRVLAAGENDTEALASAVVELARLPEGETVVALTGFSAAERMLLAKRGHALPDGSYPIPDKSHLHPAAVLAASGHGDHVSARKLIKKRARDFGVDHTKLPGFGPASTGGSESLGSGGGSGEGPSGGGGAAMSVHQRLRRAGLTDDDIVRLAAGEADDDMVQLARSAAADDEDTLSRIVRENPRMFKPTTHPVGKVTTKTRAHSTGEDPTDREHPRDGGVVHPEVERYLRMADDQASGRERPSGSVQVHRPRADRWPGPAGKPQTRA